MATRWSKVETDKLCQMREILAPQLAKRSQLPDVVGDRRLLRFLRGHGGNVDKACKMYSNFLEFRDANNVDDIRNDILFGHKHKIKTPFDFPCGKKILDLVPQIIISTTAMDKKRNPISTETFGFNPEAILKSISREEYVIFMIYMLEYKILILEQLAHERELANKRHLEATNTESTAPYGIILLCFIIRDFNNFGFNHMGNDGKTVMKWILEIAVNNYPEVQYKCHMINIPWFFNTIWFFIKNLLDANILSKLTISTSSDYLSKLQEDITLENIPVSLGGSYTGYNEEFAFDLTPTGPFFYEGCPFFHSRFLQASQLPMSGVVKKGVPVLKKLITDDYFEVDGTKKSKKKKAKSERASAAGSVVSEYSDLNSVTAATAPIMTTSSMAGGNESYRVIDSAKKKNKLFSKKRVLQMFGLHSKSPSPVPPPQSNGERVRRRSSSFSDLNVLETDPNKPVNPTVTQSSKPSRPGGLEKQLSQNLKGEFAVIDTPTNGANLVGRAHSLPSMDEFLPVTAPIVAPPVSTPETKSRNCLSKDSPAVSVASSVTSACNGECVAQKPNEKLKPLPGESIRDWQARNRQAAIDRMTDVEDNEASAQSLLIRDSTDLPTFQRAPTLRNEAIKQKVDDQRFCMVSCGLF